MNKLLYGLRFVYNFIVILIFLKYLLYMKEMNNKLLLRPKPLYILITARLEKVFSLDMLMAQLSDTSLMMKDQEIHK